MKRIIISFGIIAAIIGVSIFSLVFMDKNNKEMFEQLDEITSLYENRSDDIQKEIQDFQDFWEKYYIRYSYITQCSTLDDISYSVAKLDELYNAGSDDFIPECESIKYRVKRIYDRQYPHLHSVF